MSGLGVARLLKFDNKKIIIGTEEPDNSIGKEGYNYIKYQCK